MDSHLAAFRQQAAQLSTCQVPKAGRGIVTTASFQYTVYLWLLIRSLRHHGCRLPIELWHRPGELSDELCRWLEPFGVRVRNTGPLAWLDTCHHPRAMHAIKPYVMMQSAFREVMFLDADNSALRDPSGIFDDAFYGDRGAMFWLDAHDHCDGSLRRELGLDPAGPELESGQMVIDTVRHWHPLSLTLHLNERCDFYYEHLFGDKETYRLAFDYLDVEFAVAPHRPPKVFDPESGEALEQPGPDGLPLFYHRTAAAFMLGNQLRLSAHDTPVAEPAVMRRWIADLREAWPRILTPEQRRWFRQRTWRVRRRRDHLDMIAQRWVARCRRIFGRGG